MPAINLGPFTTDHATAGLFRNYTLADLLKSCQQEWDRLDMAVLRKCLLQWKLRCRAIVGQHGQQIEHDRRWRNAV